jgi:hypothetical protein
MESQRQRSKAPRLNGEAFDERSMPDINSEAEAAISAVWSD